MGGDMTGDAFARLLSDFTLSAESGDGARFANHFTEDAVYHDHIYGPHRGAAERLARETSMTRTTGRSR
jgi:hypothetical protein